MKLGWQSVRAAGLFVCQRKEFWLDLIAIKTHHGILTGILQKNLRRGPNDAIITLIRRWPPRWSGRG